MGKIFDIEKVLLCVGILLISITPCVAASSIFWRKVGDSRTIAIDETGNNMGKYLNSPLLGRVEGAIVGDANSSVKFDGVNQCVRIPVNNTKIQNFGMSLERFSVEFWYKSDKPNKGKCVMGTINKGLHKTCFQIEINKNGGLGLLVRSEDGKLLLSTATKVNRGILVDGRFHHIVWVVSSASSGKVVLYLDGRETPLVNQGSTSRQFAKFQYDLVIGASDDRGTFKQYIDATLDEVAIYTDVLSVSRIKEHYLIGIGKLKKEYKKQVLSDKPFGYWRFGESPNQGLYLLLDKRVIEKTDKVKLCVGKVEKYKGNPLFGQEYPWEVMFNNMYPNVIYDEQEKLYKIWYGLFIYDSAYASVPPNKRKPGTYMKSICRGRKDGLCYAFSKDGLRWIKPMLDIVKWKGKLSNILSEHVHGVGVMKDVLERDPARRYKMFFKGEIMSVRFSSDGLHWGQYIACPEISAAGDTHNNTIWVSELGKYVGFTRLWNDNRRVVGRTESPDFVHWTKAVEVFRGKHLFDIYSLPVFRYAGIYLGFPAVFDERADRVWTELAWSPDTVHWYRIDEGTPLIPNSETKGDYDWGTIFASKPILKDNMIRIYYGGCNGGHFDWRDGFLCLATLRLDGFAGYEVEDVGKEGTIITKSLILGSELYITADAETGAITVELVDGTGKTLLTSKPIVTNVTDGVVIWTDRVKLKKLVGRKVHLKFRLKNAKLYSFRL